MLYSRWELKTDIKGEYHFYHHDLSGNRVAQKITPNVGIEGGIIDYPTSERQDGDKYRQILIDACEELINKQITELQSKKEKLLRLRETN